MNPQITLDEYIRKIHPPPAEGEEHHEFYVAWGYDEYLKKATGYDMDQLRVLERWNWAKHLAYDFMKEVADEQGNIAPPHIDKAWSGKKQLVIVTKDFSYIVGYIFRGFKGFVLTTYDDGRRLVWIPASPQYVDVFEPDDERIEDWGTFTSCEKIFHD